ncbi:MAG TPA: glycosyltransferase [Fluviicola sp.]|nr:glycosyltransferase [Fluviicola sp.]
MNSLDEFLSYLTSLGFDRFTRIFWFFVFFELIRFLLVDFIVLVIAKISYWLNKKRRQEAYHRMMLERPLVSVIIPGKNEGKHIYKLVNSLREQSYKNLEIIVVDDGSDDETPMIGRDMEKNGFIDLFIRNEFRGGKASAANLALRFTKGKFIVHLDADCSYNFDAIEKIIIPFYEDDRIGGVGGNVMVRNYKTSLVTTLQAIEYYDTISIGRVVASHLGIYRIISGAFGAFRADAMEKIQGWDIGPGLDGDISVKIRKIGYKVKFANQAVCLTSVPDTFKKLMKQRLRWDKSLIRFRVRKHKDVFYPNQHFRFSNFFSFLENITYNIILNIKWYVYFFDMVINFPHQLVFIFLTNFFLYTCTNFIKFIVFSLFRTEKNAGITYFIPYLPLMVLYFGYFLRIVRTVAYFQEFFFKKSYNDPWNPPKTSKHAKELKI